MTMLTYKSILDKRILECFSVIREECEGPSSDENKKRVHSRPSQDLLKSDIINPSPAPPKRKLSPSAKTKIRSPPPKKPRPLSPNSKHIKRDHYNSDDDARFAAELDQALNSMPVRKTRGAASGTKPKSRPRKVKKGDDGELPPKKKRAPNPNSAFNAPMLLSPQLAEVVFELELPRPVSTQFGIEGNRV
jgi:chromatin remodeling complex protein RSC6